MQAAHGARRCPDPVAESEQPELGGRSGTGNKADRRLEETAFTFGTPATIGVSPKARVTTQAGVFIPF